MGIGKDKLSFDATSADTLAASDTVGAYTLDGTGTKITSTLVSAKQGLDVYVTNGLTVDVNGIYNAGTNASPDNVGVIAFVRGATPALSDQTFTLTGGKANSDAVVAANVWARDSNSFNMGYNGTTWDRIKSTSGAMDVNIAGSTGTSTVSDAALANTAVKSTATNITSAAAVILGTQLAARKYLTFQNLGASAVYVGDSTVTASTGLRLSNGAMLEGLRIGPAISLKALTASGTADLRIFEAS